MEGGILKETEWWLIVTPRKIKMWINGIILEVIFFYISIVHIFFFAALIWAQWGNTTWKEVYRVTF